MKKASTTPLILILASAILLSALAGAYAQSTVSVYIMDPTNSANGGKGVSSGGYWVGQIPLRITSGSTTSQVLGYCMNFDRSITIGNTYTATFAPATDTAEWRAVSYILSWKNPLSNSEAAAAQVAVWRLLNSNYVRESWLDAGIDSAGAALAAAALGKDVVRPGDVLSWVSPITGNLSAVQGSPGQAFTFIAKLTSSSGTPRANVQIKFSATLSDNGQVSQLGSPYISALSAFTDSQGKAQVQITVPATCQPGATVSVEAQTHSVWPQRYVDVTTPGTQDLIGVGDSFQLTVSTNICIYGFITVLPESPAGPLAVFGGGVAAGSVAYVKAKRAKKQK